MTSGRWPLARVPIRLLGYGDAKHRVASTPKGAARVCAWPKGDCHGQEHAYRIGRADVRDDFDRARRRANRAKMAGWLLGRPASRNRLAVLGEVTSAPGAGGPGKRLEYERVGRLEATRQTVVPISQIVGTLDPTRCFDRQFRPTSDHVRARFQRIAVEVRSGRGMDPVELYRCGGSYYVLDGRHRIAVARALGQRSVSALVTEVRLNNPAPACPAPRPPESTWALS